MNGSLIFSAVILMTSLASTIAEPEVRLPALPHSNARIETLPNGLTIIVEENRSAPVASLQVWCGTGSIHEGKWMGAGLSHILEHMLFKGTKKRSAGEIAKNIQDQGGYVNAYTSFDRTVYWIDVPSSGVMEALDILGDAVLNSTLPEQEYTKEQEVIRREYAMGFDDANRQSSLLMLRTVFGESPFRHPVIGYLDVYNKLTREDVLEYYRQRYVPNNLTVVVTGDVDADAVFTRVRELFQGAPRGPLEPVFIASEPEQLGRRDAHEEFPATELTRLTLAWRIPGLDSPDTPVLDVLGEILGSGRSSPLNQNLREKKQVVHMVGSGTFNLPSDGAFIIQMVTDPDQRENAERGALETLGELVKNGPSAAELERARSALLSGQISGMETARGRASDLGSSWLLAHNPDFSREYLKAVSSVTAEDVVRVAKKYLTEDRLNSTSLNPPGSLTAAQEGGKSQEDSQQSGVQKFTLSNGLRVLVRENHHLPMVSVLATFRGGLLAETPANNGITRLMSSSLLKGTKSRSALQIADALESHGGRIGASASNNTWAVSAEVMTPFLGTAMEVVADVVRNPAFKPAEVDIERQSVLATIKAEDEQITKVASNLARRSFFGEHPYGLRSNGSTESVSALTPEALREFHDSLAVAKNGVLAVFGDVKADEVVALAEKFFGGMSPGTEAFAKPPRPTPPQEPVVVSEKMDKQQAVLMFTFPGPDLFDPDDPAMRLINEASNDLGSRFFDRIREKLGLAYFVGAGSIGGTVPGAQFFYLGTDPAKLETVTREFRDEIAKLAKGGLTEEELLRAKKKLLGAEDIQRQGNGAFAASTSLDELLGLGYDYHTRERALIEAVTLEDTRRAAERFLGVPGYVRASVGPEKSTP